MPEPALVTSEDAYRVTTAARQDACIRCEQTFPARELTAWAADEFVCANCLRSLRRETIPWDDRSRVLPVAFALTWWKVSTAPLRSLRAILTSRRGREPLWFGVLSFWLVQQIFSVCATVVTQPSRLADLVEKPVILGPIQFTVDLWEFIHNYWGYLAVWLFFLIPHIQHAVIVIVFLLFRRSSPLLDVLVQRELEFE